MKQYHELLKTILEKGSYKQPAREGMPGTTSLFGHQSRYDLSQGFPILTTKRVNFKHIVVELLWFLRGDTNIKYLVDNGVNIWNQDAYNYYCNLIGQSQTKMDFESFVSYIKLGGAYLRNHNRNHTDYILGDCGYQYGKVWRKWGTDKFLKTPKEETHTYEPVFIDQLAKVIDNIKSKPFDRRKLVTAVDPAHDADLALYWCHSLFQFNCREIDSMERTEIAWQMGLKEEYHKVGPYRASDWQIWFDSKGVPKYYLDCQMYQRSADVFLGVPYNISSYCLLTHIVAKVCNMVPGEFIHTFGDVHIYDNHRDQVAEILTRDPEKYSLPTLKIKQWNGWPNTDVGSFALVSPDDFELENYQHYSPIKAELSTGIQQHERK